MYQTSNSKLTNRERILACIFRNPSISRTGIAQLTGITPATVSHTIFQLQQEQLVLKQDMTWRIPPLPDESVCLLISVRNTQLPSVWNLPKKR